MTGHYSDKFHGESENWIAIYETEMSEEKEWAVHSIESAGKDPALTTFRYKMKSSWFEFGSDEEAFNQKENNILAGNSECCGPPLNDESCLVHIDKDEQKIIIFSERSM